MLWALFIFSDSERLLWHLFQTHTTVSNCVMGSMGLHIRWKACGSWNPLVKGILRLVHCPTWERRSRGQERTINQPLTAGSSWSFFCFLCANTDMGHGIKGLGDGEGLKWKRPKLAHYTLSHFSQWWSLLTEYCSEPPFLLFQPFLHLIFPIK